MDEPAHGAVVFDLDGTLTDSAPGILAAVRHALIHLGLPIPDDAALRRHIGPPLDWGFRELIGLDAADARRATESFREYYRDRGWAENAVYPGIFELLDRLRDARVPMAVATAKLETQARRIADHFGLSEYFAEVCGAAADDVSPDKTGIVLRALAAVGLAGIGGALPPHSPTMAVVVGDRTHDFEAAATLHLESIAVEWGYGGPAEWKLATYRAALPEDVAAIVLQASDAAAASPFS